MSKKSIKSTSNDSKSPSVFLFSKQNYYLMLVGLAVIVLGFILMSGGGSDQPEVFNEEIYSKTRIRIAPAVILFGLAIEVFAIIFKGKK